MASGILHLVDTLSPKSSTKSREMLWIQTSSTKSRDMLWIQTSSTKSRDTLL